MWPKLLDMSRDECKRTLRRMELESYASMVSAFRAQGDLSKEKKKLLTDMGNMLSISTERHRAEVRRAVNDEKLTTIADHLSGPNNCIQWGIEGRRLVPLMPRLVPQTAFTVTAHNAANSAMLHNMTLPLPSDTGFKSIIGSSGSTATTTTSNSNSTTSNIKSPRPTSPSSNVVVLPSGLSIHVKSEPDVDEKSRKRRRSNSVSSNCSSSKEVPISTVTTTPPTSIVATPRTTVLPITNPKITTYMTSTSGTGLSPVKITFTKASSSSMSTLTPAQKVIIVSSSSTFTPNILQRTQSSIGTRTFTTSTATSRPSIIFNTTASTTSGGPSIVTVTPTNTGLMPSTTPVCVVGTATTAFISNTVSSAKPRPKTMHRQKMKLITTNASSVLATAASVIASSTAVSPATMPKVMTTSSCTTTKPSIQIVQEHGVKIITQTVPGNKILPKPITIGSTTGTPIVMVTTTVPTTVVMTTKPITNIAGSHSNQVVINSSSSTRISTTPSLPSSRSSLSAGSIITVTPKSLQSPSAKSATVVMTKPYHPASAGKSNVIIVQKAPTKTVSVTKSTPITSIQKSSQESTKTIIVTSGGNQSKVISTIHPGHSLPGSKTKTQQLVIRPKPLGMQAAIAEQVERRSGSPVLAEHVHHAEDSSSGQRLFPPTSVTGHISPAMDDTSSVGSGHSDVKAEPKHTDILEAAVAAITNGNQWVEYDVPMETVTQATTSTGSTYSEKSASSAIKALLEIRRDPSKESTRPQTIDLSKMAVPLVSTTDNITQQSTMQGTSSGSLGGTSILTDFFNETSSKPSTTVAAGITGTSFLQTATMEVEKALQERNKALRGKLPDTDNFPELTIHKAGDPQPSSNDTEEQGFQPSGGGGGGGGDVDNTIIGLTDSRITGQLDPQTGLFHIGETGKHGSELSRLIDMPVSKSSVAFQEPIVTHQEKPRKTEIKGHSELLKHLTGNVLQEPKEIDPYDFLNRDFIDNKSTSESQQQSKEHPSLVQDNTAAASASSVQATKESSNAATVVYATYPSAAEKLTAMAQTREETNRVTSLPLQRQVGATRVKTGLIPLQDIASIAAGKLSTTTPSTSFSSMESMSAPTATVTVIASSTAPNQATGATCVMVESTGLDTSHMNLEDFTSQRLLHEEDRGLRHDESFVWEEQSGRGSPTQGASTCSSGSGTESLCTVDSFGANVRASKRKRKAPIPIDEAPMPSNLPSWVRAGLNLLQRVSRYRGAHKSKGELNAASWFTRPVDPHEAPGYHKIIKQPMDFGTIKKKLETGQYRDFNDFNQDMILVKGNCMKYNPLGHEARKDCEEVFQFYTVEYNKMIDKWQKIHCTPPKSPKKVRVDCIRSPIKS
ncbi:BRCA2-interacting transcriptional repressor EMSY-like [Saccoglossus kowalevskii]|uniref:Protein EMSY-like n=1 Tax=Saccoglossus kowalevskii TaxID=10224 RepID=A0ABM0LVV8_SACKO|nr:PREDICTED: protein EMSY-like [Saccoglossus kowalevskii]